MCITYIVKEKLVSYTLTLVINFLASPSLKISFFVSISRFWGNGWLWEKTELNAIITIIIKIRRKRRRIKRKRTIIIIIIKSVYHWKNKLIFGDQRAVHRDNTKTSCTIKSRLRLQSKAKRTVPSHCSCVSEHGTDLVHWNLLFILSEQLETTVWKQHIQHLEQRNYYSVIKQTK